MLEVTDPCEIYLKGLKPVARLAHELHLIATGMGDAEHRGFDEFIQAAQT
jgi:hypothetical protein